MVLKTQEELCIKVESNYVLIVKGIGTKTTEGFTEIEPFTEMELFEEVIDCMYFALLGEDMQATITQHLGQVYQEVKLHYIEYITKDEYLEKFYRL